MRSLFLTVLFFFGCYSSCPTLHAEAVDAHSRLHILFIVAGDLGWRDPGETKDLSGNENAIRDRLLKKLRTWQQETHAYIPREIQPRS